jgi:hypothetical protein
VRAKSTAAAAAAATACGVEGRQRRLHICSELRSKA